MRATNRLKDSMVRTAKPAEQPYKLADGGGLFLLINPDRSRYWRLKYRHAGREKLLSLGVYPDVSLADARAKRDAARSEIGNGIDPSAARKARRKAEKVAAANSFEAVAREWYAKNLESWAPGHARTILSRLTAHVFPFIGASPIAEIHAPELLDVLERVEKAGIIETAHRVKYVCGQVFRYAIGTRRALRDPSADLRDALTPVKAKHLAAVTEPAAVRSLLAALDAYQGTHTVQAALRLAPLVFVRPGELRRARWADVDLDAAEWRFTLSKTGVPHLVPLATQAVAILRELHPYTCRSEWVFPGARSSRRPMSDNAILSALRSAGIPRETMTGHGFRAMARTILDQELSYPVDWIEHQLGHAVKDPNGRAYNRTTHLPGRVKMMQAWADYLDRLRTGADVIDFAKAHEAR